MSSRFKKSLGLFKYRQSENPYRISKEIEFEEKFVEMPSRAADLEEKTITNMQEDEIFDLRELKSFYMNIYAALRFTYECEATLCHPHRRRFEISRNSDGGDALSATRRLNACRGDALSLPCLMPGILPDMRQGHDVKP